MGTGGKTLGEARARRRAHAAMLSAYPWCIYCGQPATTVEHMPPLMMFLGKLRPKGLEFPTCAQCNHGTKHADLVASLLSRTYPDPASDQGRDDLKKVLQAVGNNIPGLLEEMLVGKAGQKIARRHIPDMPAGAAVLRANGPLVTRYMTIFAAKFGFAMHYEAYGERVPDAGGVQPRWFSNTNAARGELPMEIIELLPPRQTLRQGRKEVSDQFEYSGQVVEDGRHALAYAVFRSSFAIFAATAVDQSELLAKYAGKIPVFRPGDFRR